MADFTDEQFEKFLEQMRRSATNLDTIVDQLDGSGAKGAKGKGAADADKKIKSAGDTFKTAASGAARAFDDISRRADTAFGSLSTMVRGFQGLFGAAVMGEMIRRGEEMVQLYQSMADVGQTFQGSLMKMSIAAGEAGLPLRDFAELIRENSEVAAELGQGFGKFTAEVRSLAERSGMYGYSIQRLNAFTGEYMKTARLYGDLQSFATGRAVQDINDLALTTTSLSAVTGRAREEISRLANEAMRGSVVIGAMFAIEQGARQAASKKLLEATTFMASQTGKAGEVLSKMIGETWAAGSTVFTEGGKMLIEGGLGQMANAMDQLAAKVREQTATESDYLEYLNRFQDEVDGNIASLKMQALAGNANAATILEMRAEMDKMTEAQRRQKALEMKDRETLTGWMLSFESGFQRIIGGLRAGFLKGFEPAMKRFEQWTASPEFDAFVNKFTAFGERIGSFLAKIMTPANIENFVTTLGHLWGGIKNVSSAVWDLVKVLTSEPVVTAVSTVVGVITGAISTVAKGLAALHDVLSGVNKHFATAMTAVAAFGLMLGGKKLLSMVGSFIDGFKASATINAQNVYVNSTNLRDAFGPVAGGGSGGGGGGSGGGGSRWARFRGAMSGARGYVGRAGAVGLGMVGVGMLGSYLFSGSEAHAAEMSKSSAGTAPPMSGLRLVNANMIRDPKERAEYIALVKERLRLSRGDMTPDDKARLEAIDKRLGALRDRWGARVDDARKINDVALGMVMPSTPGAARVKPPGAAGGASGKGKDGGWFGQDGKLAKSGLVDAIELGLLGASFIPGVGLVAGAANTALNLAQGDLSGAGMAALSMLPLGGILGMAGRGAMAGGRALMGSRAAKFGALGAAGLMVPSAVSAASAADYSKLSPADDPVAKADAANQHLVDIVETQRKMLETMGHQLARSNMLAEETNRLLRLNSRDV